MGSEEVREERMRLRRKLDKGQITDEEYEREIQKLVVKGKKLLAEQAAKRKADLDWADFHDNVLNR